MAAPEGFEQIAYGSSGVNVNNGIREVAVWLYQRQESSGTVYRAAIQERFRGTGGDTEVYAKVTARGSQWVATLEHAMRRANEANIDQAKLIQALCEVEEEAMELGLPVLPEAGTGTQSRRMK